MYGLTDSARLARDAFYVSVGFGLLGFQKLQVRRRAIEKEVRKAREQGLADPVGRLLGQSRAS